MAANMVTDVYREIELCVHTSNPPSDQEWDVYVNTLKRFDPDKLRTLVFTDGGAPNGAQRQRVNEALAGKTSIGAVVTNSVRVRSAVTLLSWFNPKIKAFSPADIDDAFRYLGLSSVEIPRIWIVVDRMRERLGAPKLECIPVREGA